MKNITYDQSSGFTLIEILVVVAIVSMLGTIVFASLNSARARARDVRRRADLNQLRTALELYYDSHNQTYPDTAGVFYTSEAGAPESNNGGNWIPGLVPQYISRLPHDPRAASDHPNPPCSGLAPERYIYSSDGPHYKLLSYCAPEGVWTSNDGFYDPVRPNFAWMVCSGAPACNLW